MGQFIPVAMALASTAATVYGQKKTADKQDAIAAQGIREQQKKRREIDARISKTVSDLKTSDSADERSGFSDMFNKSITANRAKALSGLGSEGNVSDDFTDLANQRGNESVGDSRTLAGLASRIDAPIRQRQNERLSMNLLGQDTGILGRDAQQAGFMNRMKFSNVRSNPWLQILAAGLSGAGQGMAAGGGGGEQDDGGDR